MERNLFCTKSRLGNEADVEAWFLLKLLDHLGYNEDEIRLKESLKEHKIGKGSKSEYYRPDFLIFSNGFPSLVIDAKHPKEKIENWTHQCSSYSLEINKEFEHNPVLYYIISNGLSTSLYKWDSAKPILVLSFEEVVEGNEKFESLVDLVAKGQLGKLAKSTLEDSLDQPFELKTVELEEIFELFAKTHQFIWRTEKKTPSASFHELMKIIFIKIRKDKELHERYGDELEVKVKDVVFSVAWIKNQTESRNPINDPLFKNLLLDLEREIRDKNKKRIFEQDENIRLSPYTIEQIVSEFEHIDFFAMDEDIHGRMFESFLDATIRGQELGQFFTPRDIVNLMVELANIHVSRSKIESVLDACCGSGGFLLKAMNDMTHKVDRLKGLTKTEKSRLKREISNDHLVGIDAGSDPPVHRIARMNMYLHGDGGSQIFFADALDKNFGIVGQEGLELEEEILQLREMMITNGRKFDVILSNPPFSLRYDNKHQEQKEILEKYETATFVGGKKSLLSSVMFIERYNDLVSDDGRILAIIDDSVLSGKKYQKIREYLLETFLIVAIISLPGDAFRRAKARVKTSILILRKKNGEEQGEVFVEQAVYLGLTHESAKRINISIDELNQGKRIETERIISNYFQFLEGTEVDNVVDPSMLKDRMDVKFINGERGRSSRFWQEQGFEVSTLGELVTIAGERVQPVSEDDSYALLKVSYNGEVLEGEEKNGEEISYSKLYQVNEWDILFSNMGIGRGAIGIVPSYHSGKFVSNEYTILEAKSNEEAIFYIGILRTKEILADVLSIGTGMNRGRIKWDELSKILVPKFKPTEEISQIVSALESLWESRTKFFEVRDSEIGRLSSQLHLNSSESRRRWLANKPPE